MFLFIFLLISLNPECRDNGDWIRILEMIESAKRDNLPQSLLDDSSLAFTRLAQKRLKRIKKVRQSRGDVAEHVPLAVWVQMVFERDGGELLFNRRLRRGLAKDRTVDRTDFTANYEHYISVTFYSEVS